jgi:hypothetical protein
MSLKPVDVVVVLSARLWATDAPWSYERLGAAVGVSALQAHAALRRLSLAGLYRERDRSLQVHAFAGFAAHGIPYVFPASLGGPARGMPTAHAAPPLSEQLIGGSPYVWAGAGGIEGLAIEPLHPRVPEAAARDERLYGALALIDALRVGRVRERQLAVPALERLLAERDRDAVWVRERGADIRH